MGADSTLIFYGVRIVTTEDESHGLQLNTDPRIRRARDHQLAHWWGRFSVDSVNDQCYLLIGSLIAQVGHEGVYQVCLRDADFQPVVDQTKAKLSMAGFSDEPALHILFEPDY